ncbi:efflux RND transporter periplasmic adaptor subunit [Shewanella sp. JM162201]|uniref:Efflux RND transporter periplasmic adaptor subunit n=1 Tax=Shewanella jiangmenensis TaxID=2837387 RepID=A0ABS5V510_9GAMM|nr:efflux RND transporter periplasmic adaptor subunit [Shewanella jiangmenensis]MBT1445555.1 efflux RND transporter periplasmic adaptor subunit [Shewanella jiangmenensis]
MKKIVLVLALLGGAGVLYWYSLDKSAAVGPRVKPIPNVVVTKAGVQTIRDEVEALGTTRANESLTITAKVTELVTKMNFDDGDVVAKGAVLVQLQDSEHRAKVQVAKVKVGDAERELERIRTLVTNKTVAALERDRLQTQIDTSRAELEQAQAALADRTLVAPFAGRLGLRQVSPGALVTPSTPITTLDDISVVKLDFAVPERFIPQLNPGKMVEAEAVAYQGQVFKGKVISIDSRVNPATRAVMVRAEIPNKDAKLLPGMLMKIRLIKTSREALMIPEAAVIPLQNRHYVYLVGSDNKVERREVVIGLRKRGWAEVVEGLSEGEAIMVHGILKVRPGDEVKPEMNERFSAAVATEGESAA